MRALSNDLRERIVAARAAGESRCEVAKRFCVSVESVNLRRARGQCNITKGCNA